MLEKIVEIAKENAENGELIVRLDMQFNYNKYAWTARVFYNSNRIVDIEQTIEGFKITPQSKEVQF